MTEMPLITKSAYATTTLSGNELMGINGPTVTTAGTALAVHPHLTPRRLSSVGRAPAL